MPWFEHIEKNDVKSTEIANAIDCIKTVQSLQQQKDDLENEIESRIREGFSCGKYGKNQKIIA